MPGCPPTWANVLASAKASRHVGDWLRSDGVVRRCFAGRRMGRPLVPPQPSWTPLCASDRFCLAGPALFLTASTDVLYLAIGGLIVFGLAKGCADANNMPILCQIADRRHRATGFGVMNFVSCVVSGVLIYAAGAIQDAHVGLNRVFQCSAAGVVLAVLLLLLIEPKRELEES